MKRLKYIIAGATLLGGAMLSGCGDFLEPKSKSEFVPKDAGSLNELLLGEAYPRCDIGNMNVFLNLMDDDITAAPYQKPHEGFNVKQYQTVYTWQPEMFVEMEEAGFDKSDIYATFYSRILGCNAVLDYIGDVVDSEANINRVKAQALALRAFYYFKLVNIFGEPVHAKPQGMGVPLKLSSQIEEKTLSRSTVGDVYAQIEKDLLEAERLYKSLPVSLQWKPDTRTSLPMVQLLLSRMYLYMERWEEASRFANEVMKNTQFKLMDLNTVVDHVVEGKEEFPIYTNFHSQSTSREVIWVYGNSKDMTAWVSDNMDSEDGRRIHPYFRASDELMDCFDRSEGDLRTTRYVTRSWFEMELKKGEPERMPQAFGKVAMMELDYYRPSNESFTFARSFRLSEAYLNFMEAEMMKGDAAGSVKALEALNTLRKYRVAREQYKPLAGLDNETLLTYIKDERRRELCFEDHRWYDLRRWGMKEIKHIWYENEETALEFTLNVNDPLFTVPLPEKAIEANSELEQIPVGFTERVGVPVSVNE